MADAYEKAAVANGHEVRRQNIGSMHFDPVLWKGYREKPPLEPDIKTAQANLLWCEKWVIFYPMWWGSVPAIFKGYLDRVLMPGFAFRYRENSALWDKLLAGRTAEMFSTCDAPVWWVWLQYRNTDVHMMKRAVLGFCGFGPVRHRRFGGLRTSSAEQRDKILQKVAKAARQ